MMDKKLRIFFWTLLIVIWIILGFMLSTAKAVPLTDCQQWVIKNWLKPAVNFETWAIIADPNTQCYVSTPTLADANAIAEQWVNGDIE